MASFALARRWQTMHRRSHIFCNEPMGGVVRTLMLATIFAVFASESMAGGLLTHCEREEEVFFSCEIEDSGKTVSLCGRSDEFASPVWAQYRFGVVGRAELIFPSSTDDSLDRFGGVSQSAKAIGLVIQEVWFKVGAYDYLIEHVSGGDCDGACKDTNGLVVFKRGNVVATLSCGPQVINNLAGLYGHISDDQSGRP
jgi:hypothetical protein